MIQTIPSLCGSVAGKPSPLGVRLHNAGYQAAALPFQYVAMGATELGPVIDLVRLLGIRGLGVSMPFKVEVMKFLDEIGGDVDQIGACNTVVNQEGHLVGHNTDWLGAREALREVVSDVPGTAVIVGAGGAARAIAYALKDQGLDVYVATRRTEAAEQLVADFDLSGALSLEDQGRPGAGLIVNATPDSTPSGPVALQHHPNGHVLFDVAFQQRRTWLMQQAVEAGMAVVPGWRMLLHQAVAQFQLYTRQPAPTEAMAAVLEQALPE